MTEHLPIIHRLKQEWKLELLEQELPGLLQLVKDDHHALMDVYEMSCSLFQDMGAYARAEEILHIADTDFRTSSSILRGRLALIEASYYYFRDVERAITLVDFALREIPNESFVLISRAWE